MALVSDIQIQNGSITPPKLGTALKYTVAGLSSTTGIAMGETIPQCTPEERWLRPTKYAVMKKGRKRAIKLHDNETEAHGHAETLGKDHLVELRKGEAGRCEKYCPVALFCPQFQKEKK